MIGSLETSIRGQLNVQLKIRALLLTPPKLNCSQPSVSRRDWFQNPQGYQSPRMLQSLINWCRAVLTVSPTLHIYISWISNRGLKTLLSVCSLVELQLQNPRIWRANCIYWKKSVYKWTHTVHTPFFKGHSFA